MTPVRWLFLLWLLPTITIAGEPATSAIAVGKEFPAIDTLSCGNETDRDAKDCLANLSWQPTTFTVQLEAAQPGQGDYLMRFPSPQPIGNAKNDLVSMEWFAARDATSAICKARAIVVVHESAHSMTVGRLIARGLNWQGFHTFLIQLPGYGVRHVARKPMSVSQLVPMMRQGIADVRRARDAVVALPAVDHAAIGLEGTSLGGFVAATVAGLDHGYDRIFILLAGGNVEDVLLNGSRDAAKIRDRLHAAGVTDHQIRQLAHEIEPLRLAHRINPAAIWLYSGAFDNVVPPRCSLALAKAANLPKDHLIEFPADHYLGIIFLPEAVQQMSEHMREPVKAKK
jgi:dienelactone hydrolase